MAVQRYRYRQDQASVDQAQLRAETDATTTIQARALQQFIDIDIEETLISDLDDAMALRGYVRIQGPGVTGTPTDAQPHVLRAGDTMTGALNMNNQRVQNVPDIPVANTDAVNANYVQAAINGRDPKESCRLATTTSLIAAGWTEGGSGVGKTLTSPNNNVANNDFDGVTAQVGDRILVKDGVGAAAEANGIYAVTQLANGTTNPAILTRATDFDQNAEVTQGVFTFVTEGATQARIGYILITADPITVDTTQLVFTEVIASDQVTGGAGLVRAANELAVELHTAADAQGAGSGGGSSGLEFSAAGAAGQLRARVDPAGGIQRTANGLALELDAAGALQVGTNGASVRVDGTTVQIVGNQLTAPGSAGQSVLTFGAEEVGTSQTDRFLYPGYGRFAQTSAIQIRAPRAGTLRRLRVRHNSPQGNGNAIDYTVRVNGAPTSITVALASSAADGSDLVNTAAVNAGDAIDIICEKTLAVGTSPRDVVATLEFA